MVSHLSESCGPGAQFQGVAAGCLRACDVLVSGLSAAPGHRIESSVPEPWALQSILHWLPLGRRLGAAQAPFGWRLGSRSGAARPTFRGRDGQGVAVGDAVGALRGAQRELQVPGAGLRRRAGRDEERGGRGPARRVARPGRRGGEQRRGGARVAPRRTQQLLSISFRLPRPSLCSAWLGRGFVLTKTRPNGVPDCRGLRLQVASRSAPGRDPRFAPMDPPSTSGELVGCHESTGCGDCADPMDSGHPIS